MGVFTLKDGRKLTTPAAFDALSPEDQQKALPGILSNLGVDVSGTQQPAQSGSGVSAPVTPDTAPAASQQEPQGPQSGFGTFANAIKQSFTEGLPAALENGASVLGHNIAPSEQPLWDSLAQKAAANRQELAQNYQRPSDVPASASRALGSGDLSGAAKAMLYDAAENAGTTGLTLGSLAIPYVGPAVAATLGGLQGADMVQQSKQAAGLKDSTSLTLPDAGNVAFQSLVNLLPTGKLVKPLAESGASAVKTALADSAPILSRLYDPIIDKAAAVTGRAAVPALHQGAASAVNQGSLLAQGGDVGSNSDVLHNIADAALGGAALSGLGQAGEHLKNLPGQTRAAGQAAGLLAHQHLTQEGREQQELLAYQNAADNGQALPELSPGATNRQARLEYQASVGDRADSQTPLTESGVVSGDVTAKGDLKARKLQLLNIADNLKALGSEDGGYTLSPKEMHKTLVGAIDEAATHNSALAPEADGSTAPTHIQRLRASGLPPEVLNPILTSLNTLNYASYDGKKLNRSPVFGAALPKLVGAATPAAAAILTGTTAHHMGVSGGIGAGLGVGAGALARDYTNKGLNTLARNLGNSVDTKLGLGTPTWQKGQRKSLMLADKLGLRVGQSQEALNDYEQATRDLVAQRLEARVAAKSARPTGSGGRASGGATNAGLQDLADAIRNMPQGGNTTIIHNHAAQAPQQAPQAAPQPAQASQPQQPAAQAPQAPQAPAEAPHVHTAAELAMQRSPGWLASVAQQTGTTPLHLKSFLSNQVADGALSPQDHTTLMHTDNIGDNINAIRDHVGLLQNLGQWDDAARVRDPDATPQQVQNLLKVDMGTLKPAAGSKSRQSAASQKRPDKDFDGKTIKNMTAYKGAANAAMDIGKTIIGTDPELTNAVHAMNHTGRTRTSEGSTTPAGRQQIMEEHLARMDPVKQGAARTLLSALIDHGYKKGSTLPKNQQKGD